MRILKCYLANDAHNRFVNASEACRYTDGYWTCPSCGCDLILHLADKSERAWFEHDQTSIPFRALMKCAWVDPEVKEEARLKKLRQVTSTLDKSIRPPQSWYCVLCDDRYHGNRYCRVCDSGLYSIERDVWYVPQLSN